MVVAWKILKGEFTLESFSFSELLSLLLALFAISLSMVFYLKVTETANTFYDNTYQFTSNVSEILGRIEAGFSEKLRHIDEGYSRLGDKFDKLPLYNKSDQEIKEEKQEIDKKEKEKNEILEGLFNKASLQRDEKEKIASQLEELENELSRAKSDLASLQKESIKRSSSTRRRKFPKSTTLRHLKDYIERKVLPLFKSETLSSESDDDIKGGFNEISSKLPKIFLDDMVDLKFIDKNDFLSDSGVMLIRDVYSD